VQLWPLPQEPQEPPQPSEPHFLLAQFGTQQLPPMQLPVVHAQSEQLLQSSPSAALQVLSPHVVEVTQAPFEQI